MTFLNKPPCNATRSGLDGEVVALNADTGKVRWRLKIGPTESSPLVLDGVVYVGDWNGKRLRARARASGARAGRSRPATRSRTRSPTRAAASTSAPTTTTSTR